MMRGAVGVLLFVAVSSAQEAWPSGLALPTDYNDLTKYGEAACDDSTSTACCCKTNKKGTGAPCDDVETLVCVLKTKKTAMNKATTKLFDDLMYDGGAIWIIFAGALVFFMQCGFAMLEAGAVRADNTLNIIFKNLMDICFGGICFYCWGYAFAYGKDFKKGFIGGNNFFLGSEAKDEANQYGFFFQFAFAATAATIVSGCVAERMKLTAYFVYSIALTSWVYPVIVHWVWSCEGWLAACAPDDRNLGRIGMIDFAGSGVVHMTGGFAGLCGAIVVGPRLGRFDPETGEELQLQGQSPASHALLSALGTLILWFGWYGFNAGSTLAFDGANAGKVATTTTLAAATASLSSLAFSKYLSKNSEWDLDQGLNGVLAGLVSITAGCSVVDEWAAIMIGLIGGVIYVLSAKALILFKIDDPINAFPVHGVCGLWGVLSVAIFMQRRNLARAYGSEVDCEHCSGEQFAVQLAGAVCIIAWTCGHMFPLFYIMKLAGIIRVDEEAERMGLDREEHGGMVGSRSFMNTRARYSKLPPKDKQES